MYCTKCGNQVGDQDLYCSRCGSKMNSFSNDLPARANSQTEPHKTKTNYKVWIILFTIPTIGALAALLIPAFAGKSVPIQNVFGASFWIGIVLALIGKYREKSGLLWFFIGFIGVGCALAFLIGIGEALNR